MPESTIATSFATTPVPLSRDYRSGASLYDEMSAAPGALRPHWEYLIRALEALDAGELSRRGTEVRRLLHENGVTYNVYDEPQPTERLWPLDPLPLLLTSAEWSVIEQGLIQRAEVLDLVLADIYGPRRLLRSGMLPPELICAHPGFLRPCDAVRPTGAHHLQLYAADLARAPDGQMCVIGDRSQAPSGAGYALENRTVLSRVFPSLYRDSHVHRLALYFRALRSTLVGLDPRRHDNPRIVLLTPGPENETYFEHAYLANYLGLTLVQGGDLTVHNGCVWLRTLDGLKRVDVILRRLDDTYCDPLELRADSLLGTPGLLQAARLGQVAIANPLGSGILENPGLMAVLPDLTRELLGEDPKLPSVPTWWCGREADCRFVVEHLEQLVIKPIAPHPSASTVFGIQLSQAQREALAMRIRSQPHLFAAQTRIALSTAPVAVDGRLEPRPMVLRSFLVASEPGYVVMPGGLSRVAPSADAWLVSNQHGGVSKDVWVLASEPERQVSLLTPGGQPIAVTRDGDDVPGRVADDLFWLGRYAERSDGTARLLREVLLRLTAAEPGQADDCLPWLLRAVTYHTSTYPGFVGSEAAERLRAPERELLSVLLDRRRVGSLRYNLTALVRTSRSVRDRLSSDASRVINTLNRELVRPCELDAALEALQRVIILQAAFAGLCDESMSHGPGWRFLEIGRRLERGLLDVGLLRSVFVVPTPPSPALWEALLAIAHSLKTYRRRYRAQLQPGTVLDLVLLDETNPRSLGYQLVRLDQLVADLSPEGAGRRTSAGRLALDALTQVRLFDIGGPSPGATEPGAAGLEHEREALGTLLEHVAERLTALSEELTRRYFSHAEPPQQLVRLV